MKRYNWISGWLKPEPKFCEQCGWHLESDGECYRRHPIPEFQIVSNSIVRWNEVNLRRYNVLDRVRARLEEGVDAFRFQQAAAEITQRPPLDWSDDAQE